MTKISQYSIDQNISGSDKWIGSDSQMQNATKNFTPDRLAKYFNDNQVIDTGADVRFKYVVLDVGEERPYGSITFVPQRGNTVPFSDISSFIVSNRNTAGNLIPDFIEFLVSTKIFISRTRDVNTFGYYKVLTVEEYEPDPNFYYLTLEFVEGNGGLTKDIDYVVEFVSDFSENGGDIIGATVITGDNYIIELEKADGDVIPIEFAQSYRYIQSSNSSTWIVTHNLGFRPSVTVIDLDGDVVNGDITYDTANQLTLTFAQPIKGEAYLN
jgi:hypothetical protein